MSDDAAVAALHDELRWVRSAVLGTLDGLTEYEIRWPVTRSGTNLLGLVRHLTLTEAVYLGDCFDRPFPEPHPRFDDTGFRNRDSLWVPADEPRQEVIAAYHRACRHADTTVEVLSPGAVGRVPWWPRPEVSLVGVLAHVVAETNRHAGHADILREGTQSALDRTTPVERADLAAHLAVVQEAARRHRRHPR